ncbi:MAG: hypothetical protein ACTSR8_11705 [Promethearchaeota archaeon]
MPSLRRRTIVDSFFLGFMLFILAVSFGMLVYNLFYLSSTFIIDIEYGILSLVSLVGIHLWRKER